MERVKNGAKRHSKMVRKDGLGKGTVNLSGQKPQHARGERVGGGKKESHDREQRGEKKYGGIKYQRTDTVGEEGEMVPASKRRKRRSVSQNRPIE